MGGPPLRFEFRIQKLVQALAYFASAGVTDLTRLKAAKLLYFADKAHLLRYGRPIIGDRYVSMKNGPVPSASLDAMNEAITPDEVRDAEIEQAFAAVAVDHAYPPNPRFLAAGEPDLDVFSESDLEVLREVFEKYGRQSAYRLIELTHKEPAWVMSYSRRGAGLQAPMPYESFFQGQPEDVQRVRELAEAQQEDREFVAALGD